MNILFIFCWSGLFAECFVRKVRSGLDCIAQCFKISFKKSIQKYQVRRREKLSSKKCSSLCSCTCCSLTTLGSPGNFCLASVWRTHHFLNCSSPLGAQSKRLSPVHQLALVRLWRLGPHSDHVWSHRENVVNPMEPFVELSVDRIENSSFNLDESSSSVWPQCPSSQCWAVTSQEIRSSH